MTPEQRKHCEENIEYFNRKYATKYEAGQKAHGGDMWTMGAYQALENMEQEVLDQWSYVRQIRKCFDEIRQICENSVEVDSKDILEVLDRVKEEK